MNKTGDKIKGWIEAKNWVKICLAIAWFLLWACLVIPNLLQLVFRIPALEAVAGRVAFEFETIANDVISCQMTLSFLIITVLSMLSENSVLILWENRIEEALVRPPFRSFLDFTVYSFMTIFFSFKAYMQKDGNAIVYYFVLNILILTALTFKMLLIYYGREARIARLKKDFNKMDDEQKKKVREDLLVNTIKAMAGQDLKAAKENIGFYNHIIQSENFTNEELDFFGSVMVSDDVFSKVLSKDILEAIRNYYTQLAKELKSDYADSSNWFDKETDTYLVIDDIYQRSSSQNRSLMESVFKEYPWFTWNMPKELAKQISVTALWVMGAEDKRDIDGCQDRLAELIPAFDPNDFYGACREGYWSKIEEVIFTKFDLDYFFQSIVDSIVDGEEPMCSAPHGGDEKITFFHAFFGEMSESGEVSKTVGYYNSVCRKFEIYIERKAKDFNEEQWKEYTDRWNRLEAEVKAKKSQIKEGDVKRVRCQVFENWLKDIREILEEKKKEE